MTIVRDLPWRGLGERFEAAAYAGRRLITWTNFLKVALVVGIVLFAALLSYLGSLMPPFWVMGGFLFLVAAVSLPVIALRLTYFLALAAMSGLLWIPDHRLAEAILLLVVVGTLWVVGPRALQEFFEQRSWVAVALLLLLFFGAVSFVNGYLYRGNFRAFAYTDLRMFVYWLLLPCTLLLVSKRFGWEGFHRGVLTYAAVVSCVAIFQAITGIKVTRSGDVMALQTLDTVYQGVARVTVPGILIVMYAACVVMGQWAIGRLHWLVAGAALGVYAGCIYLNFGRGIWAATVLMFALTMVLSGKRVFWKAFPVAVLLAVVVAIIASLVFPEAVDLAVDRVLSVFQEGGQSTSFGWRVTENAYAWDAIRNNPIFGMGAGAEYKPRLIGVGAFDNQTMYVHNGYFFLLVKGGLLLLGSLLFLLIVCFCEAGKGLRSADPQERVLAASLIAILVALLILDFTQPEFSSQASAVVVTLAYVSFRARASATALLPHGNA